MIINSYNNFIITFLSGTEIHFITTIYWTINY